MRGFITCLSSVIPIGFSVATAAAGVSAPSTAFYYGSDLPDGPLSQFDRLVVQADQAEPARIEAVRRRGTAVFAYVSLSEVTRNRARTLQPPLDDKWRLGGNPDWDTLILDATLLPGKNPYVFPDNLPINAAKGGPGGKPGCGSLPDVAKNFPVRQLITNTGWGTGLDIRPNPGIGSPCWGQWFQSTRAVPVAPSIRQCLPGPAPGPEPYPGAPPYGAALYGPGGVPLWPGVPPAPPNPADAQPQSAPAPVDAPPLPAEAPALPAEAGGN